MTIIEADAAIVSILVYHRPLPYLSSATELLDESRFQRCCCLCVVPGALPQAHMKAAVGANTCSLELLGSLLVLLSIGVEALDISLC